MSRKKIGQKVRVINKDGHTYTGTIKGWGYFIKPDFNCLGLDVFTDFKNVKNTK